MLELPHPLLQQTEDQFLSPTLPCSSPLISFSPPLDQDDYLWGLDGGEGISDLFDTYDLGDLLIITERPLPAPRQPLQSLPPHRQTDRPSACTGCDTRCCPQGMGVPPFPFLPTTCRPVLSGECGGYGEGACQGLGPVLLHGNWAWEDPASLLTSDLSCEGPQGR